MAQILHRDTSKQLQSLHQIQHKGHAYDRDTTTRVKKGKKELTKYELHIKQKINKVHSYPPTISEVNSNSGFDLISSI